MSSYADYLNWLNDECAVVLADPPIDVLVFHKKHVHIFCKSMMATVFGLNELTFIFMNPVWQELYEKNEDRFFTYLIRGFSHEAIHQTFHRMKKLHTSHEFDRFSGDISAIDYTGVMTENWQPMWHAWCKEIRKRRILKYYGR